MPENDRPAGDDSGSRYYGPFGPQPEDHGPTPGTGGGQDVERTAPLGIGSWSYADEEQEAGRAREPGRPTQADDPTRASRPDEANRPTEVIPPVVAQHPPTSRPGTAGPDPAWPGPSFQSAAGQGFGGASAQAPAPAGGYGGSAPPWPAPLYPAPPGVPPLPPRSPDQAGADRPGQARRRPMRAAPLIALAALVALLVGSTAGYAGSRLAQRSAVAPAPQTSSGPSLVSPAPYTPPPTPSMPLSPALGESNTVQVARTALPSSVMIQVGSGTSGGTGSGFVLDAAGHIMTNNHVVQAGGDGGRIRVVFSDGTRSTATLVGRSPSYDLAVIKVEASSRLRPIRIGNSDQSQIGESVIAIGSPLALPGTVTAGIVSAKDRPVVVDESKDADSPSAYINAIQTDASINPGNSGGPLIDSQARVIGVNSAILTLGQDSGQAGSIGLGFAIPINQAMEIGNLLIKRGKATYPVIGANVASADPDDGVKLTTVESGGPAATAGLREGDVLTSIDGRTVTDIQELIVSIRTHRPGEQVELGYQRGGDRLAARVTLGSKEG